MVTVVVPSGDHLRLGSHQTRPQLAGRDCLLAHHSRRLIALDAILRADQGHRIGSSHPHILAFVSEEDRRRWDDRHAEEGIAEFDAGAFAPIEQLFPVEGRALEVACGRGELAVWLAMRGLEVLGVDVSPVAIGLASELGMRSGVADRCRFEVWDLDEGLPPGPPMDLVVCHMYRGPQLDRELVARVEPGGLLAVASLSEVGAVPGRFRARPGELREAFAELEILAEGEGDGVAHFLGRKPG
jgi:2-polyprenyl-3-methyl-5-hydroxy-6-metoxy-1,4-benzoquinol methylase